VTAWPEIGGAGFEYAQILFFLGAATGVPRWKERSLDLLRQTTRGDPSGAYPWAFLWELAFLRQDDVGIRADLDSFLLRADTSRSSAPQRWRVALWFGDSAEAARNFQPSDELDVLNRPVWAHYVMYALEDGRGAMDADRAAQGYVSSTFPRSLEPSVYVSREQYLSAWARARGRHAEWREWLTGPNGVVRDSIQRAMLVVRDVLFFGEPEDSVAAAAVRFLTQVAQRPDTADAIVGRCWTTLWRVGHADTVQARTVARGLEADSSYMCAGVIDLLVSRAAHDDLRKPLRRLDSLVRPVGFEPKPGKVSWWLVNLILARTLPEIGDTAGALAAVRRRHDVFSIQSMNLDNAWLLVSFLREEGRLAAMLGDTAAATRAYTHYLALRENPDWEPWREERDQVRRELAALVGERPRRGARP
jgi:hypothetical protein